MNDSLDSRDLDTAKSREDGASSVADLEQDPAGAEAESFGEGEGEGEAEGESDRSWIDEEPLSSEFDSYRFSRQLKVLSEPASVESSAVGALRNHLNQQHMGLGRRSLAICSVGDDVNRSLVSASLAIAAAQSGASTVLVDANVRAPTLDSLFIAPDEQLGLSDFLSGAVEDPAAVIRTNVLPNLAVAFAGSPPADPQALLAGRRFDDFIGGLMRNFDLTIVDCPASRDSSDARRVASVLRYALIVVKRDVSFVSDVKRLIADLQSDRVTVVGSFLNVD